jgi:hypothetical protein
MFYYQFNTHTNGVYSNDQMAIIAQLFTDMKHKNSKEVIPHFLTF